MQTEMSHFDFEQWAALAKTDPEAFEAKRQAEIRRVIEQAPLHLRCRLEGVQWRVDMMRRKCRHPMAACAKTFNMMWESVYGDHGLLDALQSLRRRVIIS